MFSSFNIAYSRFIGEEFFPGSGTRVDFKVLTRIISRELDKYMYVSHMS